MPDNDLIERLRQRAWNQARRLDSIDVLKAWSGVPYGAEVVGGIYRWRGWSTTPAYEMISSVGASAALDVFGARCECRYPPVSPSELLVAEEKIGHRLPDLLRRMYTEVGNGGFGPDYGILSITSRDDEDGLSAIDEYLKNPPEVQHALGLPLVAAGCNVWWYVSLTRAGNPVYLFNWDGWGDWENDSPEVAICHTTPTLAEWLGLWADGRDVWPEREKYGALL